MKNCIVNILLVLPTAVIAQKGDFIIQGRLDDVGTRAKIYLVNAESKAVLDSTTLKSGSFQLKGNIDDNSCLPYFK